MARLAPEDWLVLAFLPPLLLDAALTLAGQPVAYWLYEPRAVYEASPLAGFFLSAGPFAFIAFSLAWLGIAAFIVKKMPVPLNFLSSLFLVFSHTGAANRWLRIILLYGIELKTDSIWWAYRSLELAFAAFAAYCFYNWAKSTAMKRAPNAGTQKKTKRSVSLK